MTTLVSGSPIIQNGKLVGAVTHVMINDPTQGYGIFIKNMLNSVQDEICREDEDFVMLTDIATELNQQNEYMNPHVKGHYSAKGLELLGQCSGENFRQNKMNFK